MNNTKAYVGTLTLASAEELKQFLVNNLKQEQNYYFWRSPHAVSGIQSELPAEFISSTEGEVFNSKYELRWKRKESKYELLLLSKEKIDLCTKFKEIEIDWKTKDCKALLYEANEIQDQQIRSKETRFPKGFNHNLLKISQRYFLNRQTATVHFVALTVKSE